MKKKIKIALAILCFLLICQNEYVCVFLQITVEGVGLKSDPTKHFSSQRENGFSISNWGSLEIVEGKFEAYKKIHPQDSVLCRNFRINPLYFWNWRIYLTSPLYKLPYAPLPPDAHIVERVNPYKVDTLQHVLDSLYSVQHPTPEPEK